MNRIKWECEQKEKRKWSTWRTTEPMTVLCINWDRKFGDETMSKTENILSTMFLFCSDGISRMPSERLQWICNEIKVEKFKNKQQNENWVETSTYEVERWLTLEKTTATSIDPQVTCSTCLVCVCDSIIVHWKNIKRKHISSFTLLFSFFTFMYFSCFSASFISHFLHIFFKWNENSYFPFDIWSFCIWFLCSYPANENTNTKRKFNGIIVHRGKNCWILILFG